MNKSAIFSGGMVVFSPHGKGLESHREQRLIVATRAREGICMLHVLFEIRWFEVHSPSGAVFCFS